MNTYHEANRLKWEARAAFWRASRDETGQWKTAHLDPGISFKAIEIEAFGDLQDKQVCVLASGDNLPVFSLVGLGAQVTSVDISQFQLDTAQERAQQLGLDIDFVCSDVSHIEALSDSSFDLVYTGGGVCVWISDLNAYYAEGARLLKPGGRFIINDRHPFSDLWTSSSSGHMSLVFEYFDRGPHVYDATQKSPELPPDSKQYEFHWTISDRITALLKANCELIAIHELGEEDADWKQKPMAALPDDLLLIARKEEK